MRLLTSILTISLSLILGCASNMTGLTPLQAPADVVELEVRVRNIDMKTYKPDFEPYEIIDEYEEILLDVEGNNNSDIEYIKLQIQLRIAWLMLRDGEVEASYDLFTSSVSEIQEKDIEKAKNFEKLVESGRINVLMLNTLSDIIVARASPEAYQALYPDPVQRVFNMTPPAPELGDEKYKLSLSKIQQQTDGRRIPVIPSIGSLSAIGKFTFINNGLRSHCTASLVGRRLALTNAHCVTGEGGVPHDISTMALEFNDAGIKDIVSIVNVTTHLGNSWNQQGATDWAILTLDHHPYGRGYLGWIKDPDEYYLDSGNIFNPGYSGDLSRGDFLTLDWQCSFGEIVRTTGLVEKFCRGSGGSSGSPVLLESFVFDNADYYIVNLHNSGSKELTYEDEVGPWRIGYGLEPNTFHSTLTAMRRKTNTPEGNESFNGGLSSLDLDDNIHMIIKGECSLSGIWELDTTGPLVLNSINGSVSGRFLSQAVLGNWNSTNYNANYIGQEKAQGTYYVEVGPNGNIYFEIASESGTYMKVTGNQPPFPDWYNLARKVAPLKCRASYY